MKTLNFDKFKEICGFYDFGISKSGREDLPFAITLIFKLSSYIIDGIEVFNAGNVLRDNLTAEEYARNHSEMILISGGDSHQTETVCHGGIETAERIRDNKHLVEILRAGRFNRINE